MSRFNRSRRDSNHREIVDALKSCGCTVRDLSQTGEAGAPDILIGLGGRDYQAEIKSEHGELSKEQTDYIQDWRGTPVVVLWSADDAIRWVNVERSWRRFETELKANA